ncbi:MAG TPA: ZIP family metal transporter [Stellaceae bacterium]|nr:ZIP family metal transporter [Stellaceae bacterium]
MPIAVSLLAFAMTLAGGLFVLRIERHMALVLGFSAGAVIGVALFDLLPEAIELSGDASLVFVLVAAGYAVYHLLHKSVAQATRRGALGGLTLSLHSFLDGLAIGVSFNVSIAAGAVVAVGVVVHDLCDGINTVTVVRRAGAGDGVARRWLLADALAPVAGAAVGWSLGLGENALGLVLGIFAGFFLYIGASDLLPSASAHPDAGPRAGIATILGMAMLYGAVRLAQL